MKDIIEKSKLTRTEKFQSLESGQYWRALNDIDVEGVCRDEVLLIQSIRLVEVDGSAHTLILRTHPSKYGECIDIKMDDGSIRSKSFTEHRFLISDFLSLFEYEPNYKEIRERELKA